jgi:5'(3')-deoxyribonucleotidase
MKDKIINIGFDMDGVIVDFMTPVCRKFNFSINDLKTYKLEELFPDKKQEIIDFYSKTGYFKNIKPYPGALDFLKKIKNLKNCVVWFISKPSVHNHYTWSDKIQWINKHTPYIFDNTILTQNKDLIYLDIFVEDDPKNLDNNKSKNKILFSRPWNKDNKKYKKVVSYSELYDVIKNIIGGQI